MKEYELLEEVNALPADKLKDYILKRAECIVRHTQGDSWDDPEEIEMDGVELAHAVYRLLKAEKSE